MTSRSAGAKGRVLLYLVTEDWYFVSHRLPLAVAALDAGYDVVLAARMGAARDLIEATGCRVVPLKWQRRSKGLLTPLWELCEVVALYRRLRPDLAHHVALKPIVFGSIAARLAGVNYVVNAVAGLGYVFAGTTWRTRTLRHVLRAVLRLVCDRPSTRTIVQNPDDAAALIDGKIVQEQRVRLIRGAGVDLAVFTEEPTATDEPVQVTLASRLLWDKGVGEFVEAAIQLAAEGIDARFALVGDPDDGNPHSVSRQQLEEWAEAGFVSWWGRQDDMPGVFARTDVVCLPTVYGEGVPKVLLEAAAAGRPIIATDTPGCREVVRDGENGLLVPPRDPEALTNAMRTLIRDRALRQAMGRRGRQLAEAEFGVEKVIAETLSVYRELLEESA